MIDEHLNIFNIYQEVSQTDDMFFACLLRMRLLFTVIFRVDVMRNIA